MQQHIQGMMESSSHCAWKRDSLLRWSYYTGAVQIVSATRYSRRLIFLPIPSRPPAKGPYADRIAIEDLMHRIQPQTVDVIMVSPVQYIADDELLHAVRPGAIIVEGLAQGVWYLSEK